MDDGDDGDEDLTIRLNLHYNANCNGGVACMRVMQTMEKCSCYVMFCVVDLFGALWCYC